MNKDVRETFKQSVLLVISNLVRAGKEAYGESSGYNESDERFYVLLNVDSEPIMLSPADESGVKVWASNLEYKSNGEEYGLPGGFVGYPTEVSENIVEFLDTVPQGPFQNIKGFNIGLNEIIKEEVKKVFENYPMGAADDSRAPWNQSEPDFSRAESPAESRYSVKSVAGDLAIVTDGSDSYVFDFGNLSDEDFFDYADVPREYIGKDEDGMPEFEYGEFEVDDYVIDNYINSNQEQLSVGSGVDDYESGNYDLVKIDRELLEYIRDINQGI